MAGALAPNIGLLIAARALQGAAPVVGGAVTQGLAWQWVFWLNVPIGLVAIPLVVARMPESYGPRARLDLPGLALVTGATLGIVWGLMRGNPAGWGSSEVVGALLAGGLLTVAFVAFERRTAAPMLPMRLFSGRAFSAGNASNFLLSCSLFGAVFFMAQKTALHQGPLEAGLRLLPWTGTLFVVAPLPGRWSTGSVSGRWSSAACCFRAPGWPGSR